MTVAEVERIGAPDIAVKDAKVAYLSYRAALLAEKNPKIRQELGTLTRSYKAIASGRSIVDVEKAIKAAGLQVDTLYPRIAICRADAQWCHVLMEQNGACIYGAMQPTTSRKLGVANYVQLPADTFERFRPSYWTEATRPKAWQERAKALVPVVPPQYRPRTDLGGYHLLWDAVWTTDPPVDPLLLKHLGGPLYAVMAAWDLSPLERAVMRGRLR